MKPLLYWFRADLRLQDNLAWTMACALGRPLVAVAIEPNLAAGERQWGIKGLSASRLSWWHGNAAALELALAAHGVDLLLLKSPAADACDCTDIDAASAAASASTSAIVKLCKTLEIYTVFCEAIAAPYERAEVESLQAAGLAVNAIWQSTLFSEQDLPFQITDLPDVFTRFRNLLERNQVLPRAICAPPKYSAPFFVDKEALIASTALQTTSSSAVWDADERSAFLWKAASDEVILDELTPSAGSKGGHAYLDFYFSTDRPSHYKSTRNGLIGMAFSSKWSPWLAVGALSAAELIASLRAYEQRRGSNDGTYWLWFELLWRDYFRWLHLRYGRQLYRATGLQSAGLGATLRHNTQAFQLWTQGQTGCDLVDAGMKELLISGYLSNRMRQVVASYLIYELHCDWRAGAAWFESQLLDFDIYANQGNWLYIAGFGTDPRGGRQFNIAKQRAEHDPQGQYRERWLKREH